jgi:hypothetical protein
LTLHLTTLLINAGGDAGLGLCRIGDLRGTAAQRLFTFLRQLQSPFQIAPLLSQLRAIGLDLPAQRSGIGEGRLERGAIGLQVLLLLIQLGGAYFEPLLERGEVRLTGVELLLLAAQVVGTLLDRRADRLHGSTGLLDVLLALVQPGVQGGDLVTLGGNSRLLTRDLEHLLVDSFFFPGELHTRLLDVVLTVAEQAGLPLEVHHILVHLPGELIGVEGRARSARRGDSVGQRGVGSHPLLRGFQLV